MTGETGRPRRAAVSAAAVLAAILTFHGESSAHPSDDARRADLDARLAAEPRQAELWLQSGQLYAEAHDWERARADLERSLRLDPALLDADFELARVLLETDRPRAAEKAIDRYLRARPADPSALAVRGALGSRVGKPEAAAGDYGRAIAAARTEGSPAPPEWYLARARLLLEAAPGSAGPEALAALEEGLADLGRPVVLEWEALRLERRLGRLDAALARAARMTESSDQPAPWQEVRGEVLEEAGRLDEARAAYRAALDSYQSLPAPRRNPPAVARRIDALRDALARLGNGAAVVPPSSPRAGARER